MNVFAFCSDSTYIFNCLCQGHMCAYSTYMYMLKIECICIREIFFFLPSSHTASDGCGWIEESFLTSSPHSNFPIFHAPTDPVWGICSPQTLMWKIVVYLCHLRICMIDQFNTLSINICYIITFINSEFHYPYDLSNDQCAKMKFDRFR